MGKLTISMAIFNSYFDITRGYMAQKPVDRGLASEAAVFVCLDSYYPLVNKHGYWKWPFIVD